MRKRALGRLRLAASLMTGVYLLSGSALASTESEDVIEVEAEEGEVEQSVPAEGAGATPSEEEPAHEDEEPIDWDEGEAKARDPKKGVVAGRIVSSATQEPLIEARVSVVGTKIETLTDIEGNYELELPPGRWELRVFYELHQPQRITDIQVEAGSTQNIDVSLVGDEDAVVEIVVEAEADRSKAAVQMERRKRATIVMDAVSGEEMSKTPDSSAADAMKRVVGASIVDGKYLVVRGLGGRYNTTLLHGVAVPSPEPDLPAFPLDLFPASLLSSVTVAKTTTPDLPANFAGGALLLDTRQYPNELRLDLRAGVSADTVSTFRKAPRGRSESLDWLGFGNRARALPSSLPSDGPASRDRLDDDARKRIGEDLSGGFGTTERALPPGFSVGATIGNTARVFGNRLGYLASLSWGQDWDLEERTSIKPSVDGGITEDIVELASIRKVKLGGLAALSYELGPNDEISFVTLFSRSADDRAQLTRGDTANDQNLRRTQLAYISRQLSFNQLRGRHEVRDLSNLQIGWQANYSLVDRDEPRTRTISYQERDGEAPRLIKERSGQIVSSGLDDRSYGGGLDFTLPLGGFEPKIGGLYSQSSRDYETRRFVFDAKRAPADVLTLPPDRIFNPDTLGSAFQLEERTRFSDSYTADFRLTAAYAMVGVSAFDPLRFVVGARFERAETSLHTGSRFATVQDQDRGVDRVESDVLPSANVVYALSTNANLRAAWAMTVGRPQFRELAASSYYDFIRRRNYSGNPELERSLVHNADLRFELFPGATEVLAISAFGKKFLAPIEEVTFSDGGGVQPRNADEGFVYGIELESRVGLYHLSPALRELGITANLTLAQSEVTMKPEDQALMTNRARPLHGQSPYALNVGLLYENERWGTTAQLLYNVFGPRLDAVGINGLQDVYEEELHRLDLTVTQALGAGFDLKLAATNLLDAAEVFTQGDTEVSRFRPGLGTSMSLAWHH